MDQLTASQLAEWEAMERLDPDPELKMDIRLAFLSSLISNLMIGAHAKKGTKMTSMEDFMLKWDIEDPAGSKAQSPEEMLAALKQIASTHNEALRKKKERDEKLEARRKAREESKKEKPNTKKP